MTPFKFFKAYASLWPAKQGYLKGSGLNNGVQVLKSICVLSAGKTRIPEEQWLNDGVRALKRVRVPSAGETRLLVIIQAQPSIPLSGFVAQTL